MSRINYSDFALKNGPKCYWDTGYRWWKFRIGSKIHHFYGTLVGAEATAMVTAEKQGVRIVYLLG